MRDTVRRDQLTLFAELVETVVSRDHVNDVGSFVGPPHGNGWRITDYSNEKRTTLAASRADHAAMEKAWHMLSAGEIAHALGGRRIGQSSFVVRCPAHEDRSPSMSLTDTGDGLVLWHCHAGCSQRDVRDALVARGLWPRACDAGEPVRRAKPRPAPKPARPDRNDLVPRLWREAVDPRGTLAEKYLRGRGLGLEGDLCGRVLRFHGRCPFGKDEAGKAIYVPALIVAFRPFRDDDGAKPPLAIHRIGFNPDGRKIAKMMLGSVGGCGVKLDPDEDIEQGLGICEGIETGLAIRATGWRSIWALGSAGAIRTFEPIAGIEALTIFADHDKIDPKTGRPPGQAAAHDCAQAWKAAGCEAIIRTPRDAGADWLDVAS